MLDNTIVLFGSGASTTHNSHNLPTLIAGGAKMGLKHGTYWREGESRMSNMYLSILRSLGHRAGILRRQHRHAKQPGLHQVVNRNCDSAFRQAIAKGLSLRSYRLQLCAFRLSAVVIATAAITSAEPITERAIRHFGGRVRKLQTYDASVKGLQQYLRDSGVRRITAQQMTRPNHPDIAREHGFDNFVPKKEWWPRGRLALALLAEAIEKAIGEPVTIRNWWRPEAYNRDRRVAGASRSDHLSAHAIDIDYRSARSAQKAQSFVEQLRRERTLVAAFHRRRATNHSRGHRLSTGKQALDIRQ